jgi:hypothetical protein
MYPPPIPLLCYINHISQLSLPLWKPLSQFQWLKKKKIKQSHLGVLRSTWAGWFPGQNCVHVVVAQITVASYISSFFLSFNLLPNYNTDLLYLPGKLEEDPERKSNLNSTAIWSLIGKLHITLSMHSFTQILQSNDERNQYCLDNSLLNGKHFVHMHIACLIRSEKQLVL